MSPDILSPKSADLTAEMLAEARFQQNSAKASATDPAAPEVEGATDYSADRPAAIVTARGDAAAPHDPQQATRAIGQSSVLDALLKASPLPQLAGAAPGALTAAHPPLTGPRDGAAPLRGAPPLSAGASRAQAFTSAAQHSLHCSMPTLPHWPPPTLPRLGRWQRPPPPPTPQGRQAPRSCASPNNPPDLALCRAAPPVPLHCTMPIPPRRPPPHWARWLGHRLRSTRRTGRAARRCLASCHHRSSSCPASCQAAATLHCLKPPHLSRPPLGQGDDYARRRSYRHASASASAPAARRR